MRPIRFLIPPRWSFLVLCAPFAGNVTAEVADQCDPQLQFLLTMLWQGKTEASKGHFTSHRPLSIHSQGNKLPHLSERLQTCVLVRSQHRDHGASFACQCC